METKEARIFTMEIYEKLGMTGYGVDFYAIGPKGICNALGYYRTGIKKINLNINLVRASVDRKGIENTILHECAHALEYDRFGTSGHGVRWQTICREIGAVPRAKASEAELVSRGAYKYELYNVQTNEVYERYWHLPAWAKDPKFPRLRMTWGLKGKPETVGKLNIRRVHN